MLSKYHALWQKAQRYLGTKSMSKAELESDRRAYIALNTDSRFAISKEFDYICAKAGYAYLREQNHFQNRSRGGGQFRI